MLANLPYKASTLMFIFIKLSNYMSTLQDRIAEIMAATGLRVGEISTITGVSSSAVTQWKDGPTKSISLLPATKLSQRTGYSATWIATGIGQKLTTPIREQTPVYLENNPDYPAIKIVSFKLSAGASGFGVDYLDDDGSSIVFQSGWFAKHGYKPDRLFATKVRNGSMEPGLADGDTVVVNTGQTSPKDGAVFAVNYEGELVIKRLVRDAGQWWLASDNPDKTRHPRKVCHDDVFIIGEIIHKQSARI